MDAPALTVEGAVPGRSGDKSSRRSPLSCSLVGRMDGSLRRRRCSHCFAVSCLLAGPKYVLLVVGAVMVTVFGGAAGDDII
jgi:hypothetical protein